MLKRSFRSPILVQQIVLFYDALQSSNSLAAKNRRAFCVSMRATAVQKVCDRGNKNGAGDSNCIFRTVYPLEFLYRS